MVNSCVAYGCTNRWTKGSGIQFHRFPHASPELMKKWTDALRRKGWTPSKYSSVCSVHFTKDSYVFRPGADRQLLKPDAVPSIFSFHSQAKISRRSKLIRDAPTGSEAHFEESQFENNRADNWKKLKQTAIPTIFDLPNPPKPIASKRKKYPLVHNYVKSSKKSEEPELPPTVVTPARKCFVCSKEAGSTGSPLTALTNTTKTQLHQKLSKVIAAELDLVVDEDGVICNVCCRLLNYLDRIEVEQRLLTKSVVDCMRWTFGLGSLHDASRMPDAVLATIEDHSKYTRIPAEKSDLNVDDHAQNNGGPNADDTNNLDVIGSPLQHTETQPMVVSGDETSLEFGGAGRTIKRLRQEFPDSYEEFRQDFNKLAGDWFGQFLRSCETSNRWYVTTVIACRKRKDHDEIIQRLNHYGRIYRGRLFMWRRESDLFHIIHDCAYSNRSCRCRFKLDDFLARRCKKPIQRARAVSAMSEIDWTNVYVYFCLQKGAGLGEIWFNKSIRRLPTANEIVSWTNRCSRYFKVLDSERGGCVRESAEEFQRVKTTPRVTNTNTAASDGAGSRSNAASASERKNQTLLVPNVTEKNKKQSLLVNRTTETKKNQTLLVDRANGKNLNSQPLLSDRASGKNLKSQPLLVDGASEKKQKSQPLLVARVIREKTDAEQDDQIYHCKVCNFESKHKSVFLFHLQRHLESGYRCDFCDVLLPKDLSYLIARMQKRVK